MHSLSFFSTTYKQFHNSDKKKKKIFRRYTDRHMYKYIRITKHMRTFDLYIDNRNNNNKNID
jgi:hypothetical protein